MLQQGDDFDRRTEILSDSDDDRIRVLQRKRVQRHTVAGIETDHVVDGLLEGLDFFHITVHADHIVPHGRQALAKYRAEISQTDDNKFHIYLCIDYPTMTVSVG